ASVLAQVLARLEPREAAAISAQVVPTLARAIKRAKAPWSAQLLASALSALAARMEPRDGLVAFLQALKDIKDPGALPVVIYWRGLGARVDPQDAAAALVQAMKDVENPGARRPLAEVLVTVTARMGPGDAATTLAGAAAVAEAQKDTEDAAALRQLAEGLSAAATAGPQGPGAARV